MELNGRQGLGQRVVSLKRDAGGGEGLDLLGQGLDPKGRIQMDVVQDFRKAARFADVAMLVRLSLRDTHPDETMAGAGESDVEETGVFLTLLV
jgi:hypothetical protein